MSVDNFKFINHRGLSLSGRIYSGNSNHKSGLIFSHGLFSSKDGYKITRIADTIIDSGFDLMTFDFTFSGESSGNITDISVSEEVEDLKCAIRFFKNKGIEKIHLMGSSMGASVTILTASTNMFEIESLILIATPVTFTQLLPDKNKIEIDSLDHNGYTFITGIKVNNRFIKELFEIDMLAAIKNIRIPSLLIHGKKDAVVDSSNLDSFIRNSPSKCTSIIIEDGDHNLTRDSDINLISENIKSWLGKFNI